MTRRKGRANLRQGLWQDTPAQPYVPADEVPEQASPFLRACPACHAAPRQRCTRPARGGRRPISRFHDSRCEPDNPPDQEKPDA